MIINLSIFTSKQFKKGKTYLFFDEIQKFKELATKIKFWVDEVNFKYILSGSLLCGELKNIKSAPVGYLTTLTMFPLDFEEFLQLYNFNDALKSSLENCFLNKKPVEENVHNRLMKIFSQYLIVGGMPQVVKAFKETKNLDNVLKVQEDILVQYKKDFTKYEVQNRKLTITEVFNLIPSELNSINKRYDLSDLKKVYVIKEVKIIFYGVLLLE